MSLVREAEGNLFVAGRCLRAARAGEDTAEADVGFMLEAQAMLAAVHVARRR